MTATMTEYGGLLLRTGYLQGSGISLLWWVSDERILPPEIRPHIVARVAAGSVRT
ncbi:hypothetical protein [Pseudarthrobacter albicanus]|uniref:hypothetical protein n=1 Tax=Pseudarthrobacter albicanus TaxID=2823873 RepID=UPI001BA825BB|nr:hypothetical protein [Pseudarthrobacter albicanus]